MTHLEIAKKACDRCGACRAGVALIMCPDLPKTRWQRLLYHIGFRRRFWSLAHLDILYTYEAAGIFHCHALDLIKPLITGYRGVQKQIPIFEGDYQEVWFNLSDDLDDEEEDDDE